MSVSKGEATTWNQARCSLPPRTVFRDATRGDPLCRCSLVRGRNSAHLWMPCGATCGSHCVPRLGGTSRTQRSWWAAQGASMNPAGGGAYTIVCYVGQQSGSEWPEAPEIRVEVGSGTRRVCCSVLCCQPLSTGAAAPSSLSEVLASHTGHCSLPRGRLGYTGV